jgi:hypothetical protein
MYEDIAHGIEYFIWLPSWRKPRLVMKKVNHIEAESIGGEAAS